MKPALIEQLTATTSKIETLQLDLLPASGPAQLRESRNASTVNAYAEAYRAGETLPPIVVFHEPGDDEGGDEDMYHLADGHHRVAAAKKADLTEINAIVKRGTRRDAILYAAGANAQHGLPLTNADKRKIVTTLLSDEEWSQWSDREIADRCHVSPTLVGTMRKKTPGAAATKRKTKAGRTITVTTKPTVDATATPATTSTDLFEPSDQEPETLQIPKELAPLATRRADRLSELVCQRLREAKIKTPSPSTLMALVLITGPGPSDERFSHELELRADYLLAQKTADAIATSIASGDDRLRFLPAIPDLCRYFGIDHDSLRIWVEREIGE
jgi:hypothetical protein